MQIYFERHLADVFVLYGVSFLMLGVVIFVLPKQASALRFVQHLPLLAAFGLMHGTLEFLVLWKMIHHVNSAAIGWLSALLLLISFLPLLEFGRRMVWDGKSATVLGCQRAVVLMFYALPLLAILIVTLLANDAMTGVVTGTRYLLGFPAALLTGLGLVTISYQKNLQARQNKTLCSYLRVAGFGFIAYAIFTIVLESKDTGLTIPVLTEAEFLRFFGVPIQMMRAICAVIVAVSIVYVVRKINYENRLNELE